MKKADIKLTAPARKAILSALSERDETAAICRDKDGNPEPDPEMRDTESVPLAESVEAFFDLELRPHVPDAWIDTSKRDPRDSKVGLVGYEINFNRFSASKTSGLANIPRPVSGNRRSQPTTAHSARSSRTSSSTNTSGRIATPRS